MKCSSRYVPWRGFQPQGSQVAGTLWRGVPVLQVGECGLFSEEPGLWASSQGAAEQVFHCSITQSTEMGKINNLLQKGSHCIHMQKNVAPQGWWCSYTPLPTAPVNIHSQTNLSQLLLSPG